MKISHLLLPFLTTGLTLIPKLVNAAPVECYIGKNGSYQICDIQQRGESKYLIVWPDGERTEFIPVSSTSGEYVNIRHARSNGDVYAVGTRYPGWHNEQGGKWLCLHKEPGGRGQIDFCLKMKE